MLFLFLVTIIFKYDSGEGISFLWWPLPRDKEIILLAINFHFCRALIYIAEFLFLSKEDVLINVVLLLLLLVLYTEKEHLIEVMITHHRSYK
jgi:hypothetical protein